MSGSIPEVLFVCVHNAGRSQMAAAFLDHHAGGQVLVRSAGSTPADELNPAVAEAMKASIVLNKLTGIAFTSFPAISIEEFDKITA